VKRRFLMAHFVRPLCGFALLAFGVPCAWAMDPEPVQHEFVIHHFKSESGVELPEARITYGTYGHLNAAGDNVVLLPSHYMADMKGYEWLIGPGKALDPTKLFLVTSELFGNGRSSSPSNTREPFHGPRFPIMTIRDNVEAVHRLLTEQLQVRHLRAVIGFSMGAQQALQWAVSYPDFMDRIVATSGTAKTYGHGIVRLEGQIAALTADPAFNKGDYKDEPVVGIQAFSVVWTGWLFSQEWWRRELWRTDSSMGGNFQQVLDGFRTNFIPDADANNLILQMRTWQSNDVGNTANFHGDVEAALGSIKAQVLYMPSETDLYFPVTDARYEAAFIPHCEFLPIPSLWGHPAGAGASPADEKFLNEQVARFMDGKPMPSSNSEAEKAIMALENEWFQADRSNDAGRAAALLADAYVGTGVDGSVQTKAQAVAEAKARKYKSSQEDDMKVTVFGDTAIATGSYKGQGTEHGKPFDEYARWTDTWTRMPDGKWQVVASQYTSLKH
jgi:homoserine O-acetyltransferase